MPRSGSNEVVVNGSHGEGGGALFRTALAVAALTQQTVRIHHIRGGTRKPGLTSEDLTFVRALEAATYAELAGDELDSNELTFLPTRAPRPLHGDFDIRVHEQGSIPGNALMLGQSLLPVLARAGAYSSFTIAGETYNPNTLTYDVFSRATLPLHAKQGLMAFSAQTRAAFGYAGHGEVAFEVEPSALNGFEWDDRGALIGVSAVIAHQGIHTDILTRAETEVKALCRVLETEISVDTVEVPARMSGLHVTFVARYEQGIGCGTAMATRGIRVESVVRRAGDQLLEFVRSSATLDPYLADQVLVGAAFAGEQTVFKTSVITPRLQTMIWVIRQFVPISITVFGRPGEPGKVVVAG